MSFFSLFLLLSWGNVGPLFACSCYPESPVCEAYSDAKAIFIGQVVEGNSVETFSERLKNNSQKLSFTFKVRQNFLGTEEDKNVVVHTGFGFGDCGFPFQKGEKYLVYAYEYQGRLQTNICTRSRHLQAVEDDFKELEKVLLNQGAQISGTVTQYARHSSEKDSIQPVANLKLQIEQLDGEKKKFEVVTDRQGKYQLTGLPTAKYKVIPSLSEGLMVEDFQITEFLVNEKGCASKNFQVKHTNQIEGRVIDSKGKPVNGIWVELIPLKTKPRPEDFTERSRMFEGRFTFYHVPPGKYLVAVNYASQPNEFEPYPTVFYKVKGEKSMGTVIDVKMAQKIEGLVLQLSPPLPMKEIRGRAFWKTGKPAQQVYVELFDFESKQRISSNDTDDKGNFVIKGFPGKKYILKAYFRDYIGEDYVKFEARDVIFTLNLKTPKFKVILEKKIVEE